MILAISAKYKNQTACLPTMSSNTFISKVQISNETRYIKLEWVENDVNLFNLQILCDDGKGWSGTFSNESAKSFYKENLFQSKNDYHLNTKKCLTGEGSDEFKLDLSISGDTAKFSWKKRFEGFFQVQGSLILSKDSVTKDMLIDFLIDKNRALRTNISEMEQQTEVLNAELDMCKNELEKFVNIKTTLENTLYGKFAKLLNAKKLRIQMLEDQLQKYINTD